MAAVLVVLTIVGFLVAERAIGGLQGRGPTTEAGGSSPGGGRLA